MKKTYIIPKNRVFDVDMQNLMISVSAEGIGYGGVDTEGSLEAETKSHQWEEL